ncbi:MAG: transcriptional regulator NrdR [Oscillospiraceae bacterium]|jgi:transcriptional repressor NrdR
MKCPSCGYTESKVIDSRPSDDGERIRRRRECLSCGTRFTTYEVIETMPLMVIKRDDSRQAFNKEKLLNGLLRACEKRPVSLETLENLVDQIEYTLNNSFVKEVSSQEIGELTLQKLKDIDLVAYVRFASVYRDFKDIDSFLSELKNLQGKA